VHRDIECARPESEGARDGGTRLAEHVDPAEDFRVSRRQSGELSTDAVTGCVPGVARRRHDVLAARDEIVGDSSQPPAARRTGPKMVGHRTAQEAVKPRDDVLTPPQAVAALERAQQAVLQEVLRERRIAQAPREKTVKCDPLREERGDGWIGKREGARE